MMIRPQQLDTPPVVAVYPSRQNRQRVNTMERPVTQGAVASPAARTIRPVSPVSASGTVRSASVWPGRTAGERMDHGMPLHAAPQAARAMATPAPQQQPQPVRQPYLRPLPEIKPRTRFTTVMALTMAFALLFFSAFFLIYQGYQAAEGQKALTEMETQIIQLQNQNKTLELDLMSRGELSLVDSYQAAQTDDAGDEAAVAAAVPLD